MRGVGAAAVAGLLAVALPRTAQAQPCAPAIELGEVDAELGKIDPDIRLAWLRHRLDRGARRSGIWGLSWGASFAAISAGLFTASAFMPREDRIDLYIGGASAGVGVLVRSIRLPRAWMERRRLRRSEFGSTCEEVQAYERAVARSAKSEALGRSLLSHLVALGYNAAIGFTLGFGFDRAASANRQFSIGAVVGQTMIVTQPMTMVETLARYRDGRVPTARQLTSYPVVVSGGGGVGLAGRF